MSNYFDPVILGLVDRQCRFVISDAGSVSYFPLHKGSPMQTELKIVEFVQFPDTPHSPCQPAPSTSSSFLVFIIDGGFIFSEGLYLSPVEVLSPLMDCLFILIYLFYPEEKSFY